MAQALVTQVQNPDDSPEEEQGGWWNILCCCCSKQQTASGRAAPEQKQMLEAPRPEVQQLDGDQQYLLDPLTPEETKEGKKCLVLDLDETLVHSSFTKISDADFEISIELDGQIYQVYVRKRPGVDEFMEYVAKKFEVIIFTASLAKYADPLLDILDTERVVKKRLFREACVQHFGNYVKDLSLLGRELKNTIIIDNSPFSYMFQPDNAIAITSWFNDQSDNELIELLPKLDQLAACEDVTTILSSRSQNGLEQ